MKTVFFDVDAQLDFLYPAGALYVPGAERIGERIAELNHWAEAHGIPVISTMDAHAENDPEFAHWPPHCIAGTHGQHKPAVTLLERRVVVPNVAGAPEVNGAAQIVIEKQSLDCFAARNLNAILDRLGAARYVVYGVVTEICVKIAALGLLRTGRRVELVTDAIKELDPAAAARFQAEFTAAGGVLAMRASICGIGD